ncbi:dTDP-4-dehydrorhamnose 3,5-epimerase [Deefgea tanakiae]|uniref:dTDP-4-dehydrorhamnose 3,5-epimerase n=1 Tax=Deefgea tanakiae TaxID=2865840 RepID=A0ABX8Z9W2_9NEIS|nr:dTDP-4-dehydrorhamnose 3,5-epimerase [Deefgea tanakiae]QZA79210.1 dTDP-4-dehydrorhamnose 3,5-epimerase [Deefgea tanakiae]
MSRFMIKDTQLLGLKVIQRQPITDARGNFCRLFCAEELRTAGWIKPIAQINHSKTQGVGTIRGLHFQYAPQGEMKLVSCLHGEVWDVAVDIRLESPTYLQWHAERLSPENHTALLIPEGFAHGFQALTPQCDLVYCTSNSYAAEFESGLNPQDGALAIAWPLPVQNLSAKDASHPLIQDGFKGYFAQ